MHRALENISHSPYGIVNDMPEALIQYFIEDDWESLRDAIETLPSPFLVDAEGLNFLHYAAWKHSLSIVSNLLRLYPEVLCAVVSHRGKGRVMRDEYEGFYRCTPLQTAILAGYRQMARLLVETNPEPIFAVRNGKAGALCTRDSALHAALRCGSQRTADGGRLRLEDSEMFDLVLDAASRREDCRGLDLINVVGNGSCQTLVQPAVSKRITKRSRCCC